MTTRPCPHVLVLLGFNQHEFMRGIFAHAREARWILDPNYNRLGLTPAEGEKFAGIVTLAGHQGELNILRRYSKVPCVDLSGAWLWDLKAKAAAGHASTQPWESGCCGEE